MPPALWLLLSATNRADQEKIRGSRRLFASGRGEAPTAVVLPSGRPFVSG